MILAGAGNPPSPSSITAGAHTAPADTGFGPMPVGIGRQIIHGGGRHFIMAAGTWPGDVDGSGSRTARGDLPGSPGAVPAIIADGRRCRRTPSSRLELDSPISAAASM